MTGWREIELLLEAMKSEERLAAEGKSYDGWILRELWQELVHRVRWRKEGNRG